MLCTDWFKDNFDDFFFFLKITGKIYEETTFIHAAGTDFIYFCVFLNNA